MSPKTETKPDFHPNSFIDPMARVFLLEGQYHRGFFPGHAGFYKELLSRPEVLRLQADGKLIDSVIVDHPELPQFGLVVRHSLIETPSFSFEWPFSMLKDAARLTLEIGISLSAQNVILQDATSYNVLFKGPKPIFIDLSSLVPAADNLLWPAYNQFCQCFLFPMYLHVAGKSSAALDLLRCNPDGLEAAETALLLGPVDKVKLKGYFSRLALPEIMASRFNSVRNRDKMNSKSSGLAGKIDLKAARTRFLASLNKTVESLSTPPKASNWTDYYRETDEEVLARKLAAVEKVLMQRRPGHMVDMGCNLGEFSLLAARRGIRVTAIDSDHGCVDRLYNLAKAEPGMDILPLVGNALNPSPDMGWLNREYPSLLKRVKGDLVLGLALLHHLVFSGGQDFARSIAALKAHQKGGLLMEYVDQSDPMTQKLPRRPGVDYSWYSREGFEKALGDAFEQVEFVEELSPTRSLYLAC